MLLGTMDVAKLLEEHGIADVRQFTVTGWIRKGLLPATKIGDNWVVAEKDLWDAVESGAIPPKAGRPRKEQDGEK